MNAKFVKGFFFSLLNIFTFVGVGVSTKGTERKTKTPTSVRRSVVLAINRFSFHFTGISRHEKEISELHDPNFGLFYASKTSTVRTD